MSCPLLVTPDLRGRVLQPAQACRPNEPLVEGVIVASPPAVAGWPTSELAKGVWIVVGDGELPEGFWPFLHLPSVASESQLDLAVTAAREVLHLRQWTRGLQEDAGRAREHQLDLVRVGIALSAERDLDRLLQLILTTARELVSADAGSLYLVEEVDSQRVLRFVLAQNDSVPAGLAGATVPLDSSSLAGHVAVHGEPVNVEDVRLLPAEAPYRSSGHFDLVTGYHSRAILTVPIATRAGETVGVLQLINRKTNIGARILSAQDADAYVRCFGHEEIAVLRSLAAQAAVAIENTRLVHEIEHLFEAFVGASVRAIEQRDPSTSGHSQRVARYTLSLARAIEQDPPPNLAGVSFSRDGLTQLRYAALLHDFGKVGVREAVLTKGKKLSPERIAGVQERFRHASRAKEVALLRQLVSTLLRLGRAPLEADVASFEEALRLARRELDVHLSTVLAANEPAVLEASTASLLAQVARTTFPNEEGEPLPLLLPEELRALSVAQGSLDEEERREIESHVVHSYQFLLTIPWPKRYGRIPDIAYGHHEKLNGRGYPSHLVADEIPLEVRMMTVCDIYDALAAGDRPYKRAVSPERALDILSEEVRQGCLDPDLVRVFVDAKVYLRPPV